MERLVTENNVEHGLIDTRANAIPDHGYKNLPEPKRKDMLEKKKKDLKLVRAQYHNLKNQENGKYEGWYIGFAGEPLRWFRFLHGHEYIVPRGCVDEINDLGQPIRSGLLNSQGIPLAKDGQKDRTHLMTIVEVL